LGGIIVEVRNIDFGEGKLKIRVYFAPESGFSVASVIVYGEKDAILIDTQWSRANAYRVAAEICELGKRLDTIFVTHAHPDHYFGTEYIAEQFPGVKCIAPKEACHIINTQFLDKIDHWTEVIGWQNVCTKPAKLEPLPDDNKLYIEGQEIVIYPHCMGDLKYNSLVWIPSIKTAYGSDILFNQAHPFTCEVTREERKKWMEDIDLIESLKPDVIIPGHAKPGTLFDYSCLKFMREYLIATEDCIDNAKDAGEFFLQMCKRFPDANLVMLSNEMNANVFKGGREWSWREDDEGIS
jgi:glyoxylase-like metal-dependent hydrolase (beta-lactamase superfamily II)